MGATVVFEISAETFPTLHNMSRKQLETLGCRAFEEPDDLGLLMLFPVHWYESIPPGWAIICVDGTWELFEPGKTSKDSREGFLAYGVRIPAVHS